MAHPLVNRVCSMGLPMDYPMSCTMGDVRGLPQGLDHGMHGPWDTQAMWIW